MPEENSEPFELTIEKMKLAWIIAERGYGSSSHNLQKMLGNFRVAYHHIGQTLNGIGSEEMPVSEEADT